MLLGLTVRNQVLGLIHFEVTFGGLDPWLLLAFLCGGTLPRHRVVIVIGLLIRIAHEDLGNRKLLSSFDHSLARWLFLFHSLIIFDCRRFRFALVCRLLYLFLDEVFNLLALRSLVWSLIRVLILTLSHARVVEQCLLQAILRAECALVLYTYTLLLNHFATRLLIVLLLDVC